MRGLITTSLNIFGMYPNNNDELIILRSGSIYFRAEETSFRNIKQSYNLITPNL